MIAVDASALVAIATGEHDFERFEAALLSATDAVVGPGDCFAYALAKAHGAALLFKGDDFVKTDIAAAVESP